MKENTYPGTFIVIEGADGAGTTTQSKKLSEELNAHWTSEPTSQRIGEKVEDMISSDDHSAESIALAFAADRLVHLEEEVIPRLKEGETVVCDRYYHSSLAYQTTLGAEYKWVSDLNKEALKPDIVFLLDLSSEKALSRVEKREGDKFSQEIKEKSREGQSHLERFVVSSRDDNIFENLSFQQEVVRRYRGLPERLDEETVIVDASKSIEEVFDSIKQNLDQRSLT